MPEALTNACRKYAFRFRGKTFPCPEELYNLITEGAECKATPKHSKHFGPGAILQRCSRSRGALEDFGGSMF